MTKYQPSITEWFAAIGKRRESNIFRKEDNQKADRLEILYQTIGLRYERPEKLLARDLTDQTPTFTKILRERSNEPCAIRLVPKRGNLPKIRKRGLSIRECYYSWFLKQKINPDNYTAYICPHSENILWSAIFVINKQTIFGEIIQGRPSQLTHGETNNLLYQFRYNYRLWKWSKKDPQVQKVVSRMIKRLKVPPKSQRNQLRKVLKAQFSHNYLIGYFEAVVWPDNKVYFMDYNRLLSKYIPTPPPFPLRSKQKDAIIYGIASYPGIVKGKVKIVNHKIVRKVHLSPQEILICDYTDARYLPLMKKAAAIITNRGGILSHASIIAREFKKPCVINTKIATKRLKNGDEVRVDANRGIINKDKL